MTANLIGVAAIARAAYERRDLSPLLDALRQRVVADAFDTSALLDLATLLEVCGQRKKSAELQATALSWGRLYEMVNGTGRGLRVLQIKTAGNLMTNTPVEFLLENSDVRLISLYVDASMEEFPPLPEHDVAIMAVGESEASGPVLELLQRWQTLWPRRVLNNVPRRIMALARERLAGEFDCARHVVVPETHAVEATTLRAIANETTTLDEALPGLAYPVVVRPFGAHAGHGTQKIKCAPDIANYLQHVAGGRFTITPFFDYASPDGYYRKQRIAFIDGRPFASHMAVSRHWMLIQDCQLLTCQ